MLSHSLQLLRIIILKVNLWLGYVWEREMISRKGIEIVQYSHRQKIEGKSSQTDT